MKNNKRVFLLIEIILGILVIGMASLMIREKNGEDLERISVIIQNSDDNQWTAWAENGSRRSGRRTVCSRNRRPAYCRRVEKPD